MNNILIRTNNKLDKLEEVVVVAVVKPVLLEEQ